MLQEKLMVKQVIGATDLSLTADPGEAFIVRDIYIYNPDSNYLSVYTNEAQVGYYRIGSTLGNQLPFKIGRSNHAHDWVTSSTAAADQTSFASLCNASGTEVAAKMIGGLSASTTYPRVGALAVVPGMLDSTLLGLLAKEGIFKGFPVAEGETFKLTGASQAGAIQLVTYEIYDAKDIQSAMENGRKARDNMWIVYGNTGATMTTSATSTYDTAVTPSNLPTFPFGVKVPANQEITIYGVLASDYAPAANDGTDYNETKYIKFIKDSITLFDEDLNGLLNWANRPTAQGGMDMIAEGYSLFGNFSDVDYKRPFMFPEPLVFGAGEEFTVQLTCASSGAGANIVIAAQEIGIIAKVSKL